MELTLNGNVFITELTLSRCLAVQEYFSESLQRFLFLYPSLIKKRHSFNTQLMDKDITTQKSEEVVVW